MPPPDSIEPQRRARPSTGAAAAWAIAAAVVVALVLRVLEALKASLWLDELHTLVHASQPTSGDVARSVASEFHAPLFFLGVHLFGGWEEGEWLRALPIVSGLLLFVPVLAIARRSDLPGAGAAAAVAAWVLACAAFQVHFGAMLRPYAWLGFFSASAVYLAFTERGSKPVRFVLFGLCVALGLLTHYVMAVLVLSIGLVRLLVRTPRMLGLGWLVLAGSLAVAPTVPWYLRFLETVTHARLEHQESIGHWQFDPGLIAKTFQLPLRMLVPYQGALGEPWGQIAKLGTLLLVAGIVIGLLSWRGRRVAPAPRLDPLVRGVLGYGVVCTLLVMALSIYSWDSLPLQYYTCVAWIAPVVAAAMYARAPAAWRVPMASAWIAGALLTGIGQVGGSSLEDMRAAVARARALGAQLEAPIYSALLSQPGQFEHGLPYRAYAPELPVLEPSELPAPGTPGFQRPVVVIWRNLWYTNPAWVRLTQGRVAVVDVPVDRYLRVFVLAPPDVE